MDLRVSGGDEAAAAAPGDSLLRRVMGSTCSAERRIYYSEPRVLGDMGVHRQRGVGGSAVGGATGRDVWAPLSVAQGLHPDIL